MSRFEIKYPPGATPLDPDEIGGLIPDYITTQGELNTLERDNILDATKWAVGKKHSSYLSVSFCLELHKRMFKRVWKWAGQKRNSEKSIGVLHDQILPKLKNLIDDTDYWIKNETYSFDEIATRFHHRLVAIHIFPNGNGRHARMMTDILLEQNGHNPFTWGKTDLLEAESPARNEYLKALRQADEGKIDRLLKFVRS